MSGSSVPADQKMREAPKWKKQNKNSNLHRLCNGDTSPTLSLSPDERWYFVNDTEQGAMKKTSFRWLKRILENGEQKWKS